MSEEDKNEFLRLQNKGLEIQENAILRSERRIQGRYVKLMGSSVALFYQCGAERGEELLPDALVQFDAAFAMEIKRASQPVQVALRGAIEMQGEWKERIVDYIQALRLFAEAIKPTDVYVLSIEDLQDLASIKRGGYISKMIPAVPRVVSTNGLFST